MSSACSFLRPLVFILVTGVLVGCAGSKSVSHGETDLSEVNESLQNTEALIVWQSGEMLEEASSVHLTRDSILYQLPANRTGAVKGRFPEEIVETHTRSIKEVRRIEISIKPGGGWIGFGIGATPGLLLALGGIREDCSRLYGCSFRNAIVIVGMLSAVGVGLLGAAIGNLVDRDTRVVYRRPVDRYLDS